MPDFLTESERALAELAERATQRPLDRDAEPTHSFYRCYVSDSDYPTCDDGLWIAEFAAPADADLFIAARTAVPALLARLAAGRAEVARLKAELRRHAAPHSCGCVPCTGQCLSQEALAAELDGRRPAARAALGEGAGNA